MCLPSVKRVIPIPRGQYMVQGDRHVVGGQGQNEGEYV